MGKAAVEQRFGDQRPGWAKDACGRGENISGAWRAVTGRKSARRSAARPFAHGAVHGWKDWSCASFCGPPSAAVRIFFALSFSGKGSSGAACSAFCRAQAGVAEDSAPPALPRRFSCAAERMRAAREPRRVAALWTQARRLSCLFRPHWRRTRLFCPSVFFFGVWHSSCGRASSASGAALWNRRTVPGIRFRVPGTRVGVPSGKVGGVFPCARTQAGPPVREGLRGGSRSGFFRARTGGVVASRSVFWKISASWKAATG